MLLLPSFLARAQVSGVQPPNPTSVDPIFLCVATAQAQMMLQPIVRNGSEIRLTFRGGSVLPHGQSHFVSLGRLPAGTYSVIVIEEFTDNVGEVYQRN